MSLEKIIVIRDMDHFNGIVEKEDALLIYFSHEQCNVCKVLKPKIAALLDLDFPKMKMAYSDTEKLQEIAGQQRIFTVPTVLVFFGGREYIRISRNIGVSALGQQIERPYSMMFEEK